MRTLFLPPTFQDSVESGRIILRDGSTALIRPAEPGDRDELREFFHQLTPESKRRRFFSIADPAEALLERQCDSSNPRVQLTLIVRRILEGASRIIACASYVARDTASAEVAFAVDDEFQGRGLGGILLERLALIAARHGFVRFWAVTRLENALMLDTFRRSGFPLHTKVEDECVEIDFAVIPSEDSVSRSEARDRLFTTASLHPLFRPRAVALIGASRDATSIGYRILHGLVSGGFHGPVYAVNPSATHVHSLPAYASARQVPPGTDLAIVAIPREAVLDAVDDCAAAGVRAIVVVTAGFLETYAGGHALQEKLLERVRGHGMRLVGPNSMGVVNTEPGVRLNASVSPALPPRGTVAMSSQSGVLGLAMLELARQRHVGVSTFISVGNKADISGNDLLQYWEGDDATRLILLYLEAFGNPRRFARIARRVSLVKPIVVVKAGRRAAAEGPHGSGEAGFLPDDAPVDALFRQTGVIRADTVDEMFDLAAALDRQPLPAGRRVAILSDGSGPGLLCAGACEAARLSVGSLSDDTLRRLATFLPPDTSLGNPLELVFSPSAEPFRQAIEALLTAPEVDALVAIHTPLDASGTETMLEAVRQGVTAARAAGGAGKPVLVCVLAKENAGMPLVLGSESIPTYAFPESAARVLGKVAAYAEWRAGPHGVIPDFDDIDPGAARRICRAAIDGRGAGPLTSEEARSVLKAMRLPVAPGGVARTPDEAAALARTIGFPVAVKLAAPRLLHKTETGAVHLNVGDETAVRIAFGAIRRTMEAVHDAPAMEGVLVQPMAGTDVEVMVRMVEDPHFGPLVVFGLGGIHVEVIADVGVRVTPLTDRAAEAMVREIRGYALLEGYREHPPADLPAIHDVLLRVSRLVEEVPEIADLDLSPIFVGPPGGGCYIFDSRIAVAPPRDGRAVRYMTAAAAASRNGAGATAAAYGGQGKP
jgi:acyl-CoA synthetase (NDP forming)/GNAT superfamily N-acetyltransferase